MKLYVECVQSLGGIYAMVMIIRYLVSRIVGRRRAASTGATTIPMSGGGKKKWFLRPTFLVPVAIAVGGFIAVKNMDIVKKVAGHSSSSEASTEAQLSETESAANGSCGQCKPDEKTIGIDDIKDDGTVVWKWPGPCVGPASCSKCAVKPKSCVTDNDTDLALKCACVKQ